jgi:DNA repair ATPase RecN
MTILNLTNSLQDTVKQNTELNRQQDEKLRNVFDNINRLEKQLNEITQKMTKNDNTVEMCKIDVDSIVTFTDLNEVVNDVKNCFESLVINATPRGFNNYEELLNDVSKLKIALSEIDNLREELTLIKEEWEENKKKVREITESDLSNLNKKVVKTVPKLDLKMKTK